MSCENLVIPKPLTNQCPTTLFGIPYGAAGRTVAATTFPISAIVLHCYDGTVAELCNEMKCRTRSSVISGSYENSFHYSIGASASSGSFQQHVEDGNISWTFGTYKNNTYASVPPPNIAINWPVLQGEFGINTTPDVYTIDIALAMGAVTPASSLSGCYNCPTASGLQQTQHDMLVHMLAYLAQEYDIPIDADHITFHDLIHCGEGQECPCTDLDTLLAQVASFCPPCEQEAIVAPEAAPDDDIQFIYGITEPCCPTSPGCAVKIPWNACFVGDLAEDGTLDSYILGLSQNELGQWCLTRGCLALLSPLTGCGTVDDPLGLDLCAFGAWIPDEPASSVVNLVGIDIDGCLIESPVCDVIAECVTCEFYTGLFAGGTLETITGFDDTGACVTEPVADMIARSITVADTDCIDLEFVGNELTATLIVDPDPDNIIECRANGVFAPIIEVLDTDCIDLDLTAGVLSAQPIISPDAGNQLICQANGLYVPPITVTDNDCIDLTLVGNDLTASLIIAPTQAGVTNVFECIPGQGVFVPRGANANVNGPLTGNGSDINPLDIDFAALDAQDLCDLGGVIPADTIVNFIGTDGLDCLVAESLTDVVDRIFNTDNTDCISLDFTANVLTATPVISPSIGGVSNVLSCTATGFYVPRGADALVNGPLTGNGSDTNPIDIDFTLLDAQDLCDLGGVIPAGVLDRFVGVDIAGCLRTGDIEDVIAGAINVANTDCISMSYIGGILTASPIISGPIAAVGNALQCTATGLYVALGAGLTVQDTNCIDLTLANGILTADIDINPAGDNQFTCSPNGAYVPLGAGLSVAPTDCIDLNLIGGEITAYPIIAAAQGGIPNSLQCITGQGLFVPETANLIVFDSSCINLTLNNDNELIADVILDPNADNQLSCGPAGLYVPPSSGLEVFNTDCIALALTNGNELRATPIVAGAQGGIANALTCLGSEGLYVPATEASFIVGIEDTDCINLSVVGGILSADPIIAPAQGGCDNELECIPGQGLYVAEHTSYSAIAGTPGQEIAAPTGNIGDLVELTNAYTDAVFTNPSNCRSMAVSIDFKVGGRIAITSADPNNPSVFSYAVQYVSLINGAPLTNPFGTDHVMTMNGATFNTVEGDGALTGFTHAMTLAPGQSVTVSIRPRVRVGLTPNNISLIQVDSNVSIDAGTISIVGSTL